MNMPYKQTCYYIFGVVLVNLLLVKLPSMVWHGASFALADITVGVLYLLRDFSQREVGHGIIIAMFIATGLSYVLADPVIAIASTGAFACGELLDWSIYSFTRRPLATRLLLSSAVSTPIDSWVFLSLGHRFTFSSFIIMTLSKLIGVGILWSVWYRKNTKKAQNTASFAL